MDWDHYTQTCKVEVRIINILLFRVTFAAVFKPLMYYLLTKSHQQQTTKLV